MSAETPAARGQFHSWRLRFRAWRGGRPFWAGLFIAARRTPDRILPVREPPDRSPDPRAWPPPRAAGSLIIGVLLVVLGRQPVVPEACPDLRGRRGDPAGPGLPPRCPTSAASSSASCWPWSAARWPSPGRRASRPAAPPGRARRSADGPAESAGAGGRRPSHGRRASVERGERSVRNEPGQRGEREAQCRLTRCTRGTRRGGVPCENRAAPRGTQEAVVHQVPHAGRQGDSHRGDAHGRAHGDGVHADARPRRRHKPPLQEPDGRRVQGLRRALEERRGGQGRRVAHPVALGDYDEQGARTTRRSRRLGLGRGPRVGSLRRIQVPTTRTPEPRPAAVRARAARAQAASRPADARPRTLRVEGKRGPLEASATPSRASSPAARGREDPEPRATPSEHPARPRRPATTPPTP